MTDKPIDTIRDGRISASIWENTSEKGTWYSVAIQRVYTSKDGEIQNSSSFSVDDLLKVSRLSAKAYDRCVELRTGNDDVLDDVINTDDAFIN